MELKKPIVQLLKAKLDQQQKFEERQEKLVMELHKQQLEFQQFTQQKTGQLQELLVNSINVSKKLWKRHDIFPEYNL